MELCRSGQHARVGARREVRVAESKRETEHQATDGPPALPETAKADGEQQQAAAHVSEATSAKAEDAGSQPVPPQRDRSRLTLAEAERLRRKLQGKYHRP